MSKKTERVVHQDSGMELRCWSYGWKAQTLPIPVKYQMEFIMNAVLSFLVKDTHK
jgi:hypothetical protein